MHEYNNLAILYAEILRGFQTDTPVAAAFLDIKAYDNILIDILLNRQIWISPMFCHFIYNLISARQVWCRYGEIEEVFWLFKGLP